MGYGWYTARKIVIYAGHKPRACQRRTCGTSSPNQNITSNNDTLQKENISNVNFIFKIDAFNAYFFTHTLN